MLRRGRREQRPTWGAPSGQPRAVIENADGAESWVQEKILSDAGYEVAVCHGPDRSRCPLVSEGDCELLEGADLLVSGLHVEGAQERAVIEAARDCYPALPRVVIAPPIAQTRHAGALAGAEVVYPLTRGDLLGAVHRARE